MTDRPACQTIWLVTEGEYSGYRVLAGFSTKELAEACVAKGLGEDIAECEVDPEVPNPPSGMRVWHVQLDSDGNLPVYGGRTSHPYVGANYIGTKLKKTEYHGRSGGGAYVFTCWARDAEHAIKIANELRAQVISKEFAESLNNS